MRDDLGDRMKGYENRTRYFLPRRCYYILRIDGKSFHNYCKHLERPFDDKFIESMDYTAQKLCENIQGAKFAYVQSDEISIILTDFETPSTDAWFDGNLSKITSVSASMASTFFQECRRKIVDDDRYAFFDSRAFTLSDPWEIFNYIVWRQNDCTRNSIMSVAQSLYSHKELMNKSCSDMQELIFQKGQNWNNFPDYKKRGRIIIKETYMKEESIRNRWIVDQEIPIFTQERKYLMNLIPLIPSFDKEEDIGIKI